MLQVEPDQKRIRGNTGVSGGGNGTRLEGVQYGLSIMCWWGVSLVGDGGVDWGDFRGIPATSSRLQL